MLRFLRNTHNEDGSYRFENKPRCRHENQFALDIWECALPKGHEGECSPDDNPNAFPRRAKGISKARDKRMDDAIFIVHMLNSTKPMAFEQLVLEVRQYQTQDWVDEVMTQGEIALALVSALEQDLVKVVAAPECPEEL